MTSRFALLLCVLAAPFGGHIGNFPAMPAGLNPKMTAEEFRTALALIEEAQPQYLETDVPLIEPKESPSAKEDANAGHELFLQAYAADSVGEKLRKAGNLPGAILAYRKALGLLDDLQKRFPQWNPSVIAYRRLQITQNLNAAQNGDTAETAKAIPIPPRGYELKRPMADDFARIIRRRAAEELIEKGDDLFDEGLSSMAILWFQEALKYDPDNSEAQEHLEYAQMLLTPPVQGPEFY